MPGHDSLSSVLSVVEIHKGEELFFFFSFFFSSLVLAIWFRIMESSDTPLPVGDGCQMQSLALELSKLLL